MPLSCDACGGEIHGHIGPDPERDSLNETIRANVEYFWDGERYLCDGDCGLAWRVSCDGEGAWINSEQDCPGCGAEAKPDSCAAWCVLTTLDRAVDWNKLGYYFADNPPIGGFDLGGES